MYCLAPFFSSFPKIPSLSHPPSLPSRSFSSLPFLLLQSLQYPLPLYASQNRTYNISSITPMGCSHPHTQQRFQRTKMISIIDSNYLSGKITQKQLLSIQHIHFKVYATIEDFSKDITYRYINAILTSKHYLQKVVELVRSLELRPYIFVPEEDEVRTDYREIRKVRSIEHLTECMDDDIKVVQNIVKEDDDGKDVVFTSCPYVVAILRRTAKTPEFALVEKMFQEKGITYRIFCQFNDMFDKISSSVPYFILTQDIFTLQISKILEQKRTKLFCYAPTTDRTFMETAYYYSNDLTDIINEIESQYIEKDMISTPCTRGFIYSVGIDHVVKLEEILLKNGFEVRTVENLEDLIGSILSLFAITLFVEESEVKNVEKKMMEINFLYKTKIIVIKNIQFDDNNFNKEIKELKKGYKLTKELCKEVDIVDKNCDTVAFTPMRQQLQKHNIIINLYKSYKDYFNRSKAHSEMLICSFTDRIKLYQYIHNQHIRVKLIIYCAKNKITQDLLSDERFVMVDWNFTRIVKYLMTMKIFYPRIANFTNRSKRVEEVVKKLKNTNRRVSIQKWSNTSTVIDDFVVLDSKVSKTEISEVQKHAAELWKLEYDPIKNIERLKTEFVDSLKELKKIYKVKIQDIFFDQLQVKLSTMSIWEMVKEITTMFESSNTITMFINTSLCKLEQILPLEVLHLKEFMVLMSISSLSYFQMPQLKKVKLVCWTNKFDDEYPIGSIYLNKKFQIFYEESTLGVQESGKYKLELEVSLDKYEDKLFEYNTFVQYKSKYITMPYSKFRYEDKKTVSGEKTYIVIKLVLLKDNEYLKSVIQSNMNVTDGIYKIFSNPTVLSTLKNKQKLQHKKGEIQEITAITHINKARYPEAITHVLNAIKIYEQHEQIVNPIIISQLLYLAAFIYNELEKNEECKKYLMACLRMEPENLLKDKTGALKNLLKGRRVSKLQNLENSMMMSPLKKGDGRGKQIDLFNDVHGVNYEEDKENSIVQLEGRKARNDRTM